MVFPFQLGCHTSEPTLLPSAAPSAEPTLGDLQSFGGFSSPGTAAAAALCSLQLHPGKEPDLWSLNKYIPLLITTFHLGSLLHGRIPHCPFILHRWVCASQCPPEEQAQLIFFLTCSIQFLSRHWLRVQLCLCSQSTVSGIHSLAQLQGWLQPHALLLEPAQTGSCRQQLKCWDTGGSPAFLTEEPPHTPEEEQVVKTPIQSLTTIPIKTAIQEKRPENSACMQEGRFAFHKQMCSGQCLDGPCKERVYPGWNTGSTPGGLRQMQG